MVKTMALIAALAGSMGCMTGDNETPDQVYTCIVLYRCVGAETMQARAALACAGDKDEANDFVSDKMIDAMPEACPDGWMHVRPLCEVWEPNETCER